MVVVMVVGRIRMARAGTGAGVDCSEEVDGSLCPCWSYSDGSHYEISQKRYLDYIDGKVF